MLKPSFDKKKRVYVEAAQQSYTFNSNIPNKISVINNAMAKYKGGYKIINQWSTSRISVFRSTQLNSFIIAHRGSYTNNGAVSAAGGTKSSGGGGNGGAGSVTVQQVS